RDDVDQLVVGIGGCGANIQEEPTGVRNDVSGGPALDSRDGNGGRAQKRILAVEFEGRAAKHVASGTFDGVVAEMRSRGMRRSAVSRDFQDEESLLGYAGLQIRGFADQGGGDRRKVRPQGLEAVVL